MDANNKKNIIARIESLPSGASKILYVLPSVGIYGGVAVILQHANRLIRRGYDVAILSMDSNNIDVNWFPENTVPIYTQKDYFEFKKNSIDIAIVTHYSTISVAKELNAKRSIYFVQSDERRFTSEYKQISICESSYQNDSFEYMTEAIWIQRWLKEEFDHDVYYVPNGLDKDIFYKTTPLAKKKSKPRILIEGSINRSFKGMTEAYNAVKDLDCELWIISNNGKPKKNWKYDRFFERVPMDDMKSIYSSCDIFLKMSKVEGFFGPPLEAMACGCAVVVGKCTGYDEYIVDEKNALVVGQGDVDGAKMALQRIIEDRKLKDDLIKNGLETAKKWSWKRSVDLLEKMINGTYVEKFYTATFPQAYHYDIVMRNVYKESARKCTNDKINQQKEMPLLKFWKLKSFYLYFKNGVIYIFSHPIQFIKKYFKV